MKKNKFLENFLKDVDDMDGVNFGLVEPEFWLDFGNFIINKIMSGKYKRGIPQGRLAALAGASGSGKSFVASNVAKCALNSGIGVLYIDTENAIDKGYFESVGIDPDHEMLVYSDLNTLTACTKLVNKFIKNYRNSGEDTPYIIIIDSLDMLQTDTESDNYNKKGEINGDQGQWAKQCKKMLATFVSDIKRVNIAMLCTKQVYVNQDKFSSYEEPLKFTDGIKFAFSQICTISRLRLKDESKKDAKVSDEGISSKFKGINLQVYGQKTRFTEPFQKCAIEVPYTTGMDRYSGILDVAVTQNVIKKSGSWFYFEDEKWQGVNAWTNSLSETIKERVLQKLIQNEEDTVLNIIPENAEVDLEGIETPEETAQRRISKKPQGEGE